MLFVSNARWCTNSAVSRPIGYRCWSTLRVYGPSDSFRSIGLGSDVQPLLHLRLRLLWEGAGSWRYGQRLPDPSLWGLLLGPANGARLAVDPPVITVVLVGFLMLVMAFVTKRAAAEEELGGLF
ncbi:hypothetical protein F7D01_00335 [Erythrobacter sp. 3-20A1M]|uniref:hypothetical protein n=1 Tax=Erythrobacter sp. 3-20A1M TaxID=2653850 RepID=UPI001BFCA645|nr:hypothetical protein [Erythrobacter sp. 3-20A1M]QWC55734.1 hypothetical protein F7D01_00335 [Erythrobacter sp. 3-20A1M]